MKQTLNELEQKAARGDYQAAMALADALKWGYYGEASPERAAALYHRCISSPDTGVAAAAYYNLGLFFYLGLLEEEADSRLAFQCFLKSALLRPRKEPLSRLADMYRYGQYVEKNENIALNLYLRASSLRAVSA